MYPRWDPDWDYGTSCVGSHPGLWNIPCGLPPGIMEHPVWDPTWDPTWDYGTSHMGSHQSLLGSHLKFQIVSHLVNHIAGGIAPGILQIPFWTLPKITDGFQLDILGKILRGILHNTRDHRVITYTRKNILPIPLEPNPSN